MLGNGLPVYDTKKDSMSPSQKLSKIRNKFQSFRNVFKKTTKQRFRNPSPLATAIINGNDSVQTYIQDANIP
jgi:hypothetical protein